MLWNDTATDGTELVVGDISTARAYLAYNNLEGGRPAIQVGPDAVLLWGAGNINADPMFVGGGFQLGPGSPCINAGDPFFVLPGALDIDGEPRISGGRVDMGADEAIDTDCNGNGILDEQDIAAGTSGDCNDNGLPDECEDCNSNGVADDCEVDTDRDGLIDDCDGCPGDATKTAAGVCGCGLPDIDSDGDDVLDCNDQCPGRDDRIDENGNGQPDCVENAGVPVVSEWGLVVLGLMLATAARVYFGRRRTV